MTKKPVNNLCLTIDPELKRRLKAACATKGISMSHAVAFAAEKFIINASNLNIPLNKEKK